MLLNMTGLDELQSVAGDLLVNSNTNLRTLDGLGVSRSAPVLPRHSI